MKQVSHDELKQMCENVIHLLVTTQTSMDHIFWPRLLHYALNVDYCRAIGVIAKALAHISKTPNFTVDIDSGAFSYSFYFVVDWRGLSVSFFPALFPPIVCILLRCWTIRSNYRTSLLFPFSLIILS